MNFFDSVRFGPTQSVFDPIRSEIFFLIKIRFGSTRFRSLLLMMMMHYSMSERHMNETIYYLDIDQYLSERNETSDRI